MSPEAGHAAPLLALDAVAFDTETTGLDARVAHVVQIGALRLRKGVIVEAEQFERLVNPGRPIPPIATGVHGITDAMWRVRRPSRTWPRPWKPSSGDRS
jgi:DNA polymerase-3 subunit epsilon/CBS domain-containing protein